MAKTNISGTKKLSVLIVVLVVLLGLTGTAFIYASSQLRKNQKYLPMVSELRLLSQEMAAASLKASSGKISGFEELQADQVRFNVLYHFLKQGRAADNLPPLPSALATQLNALHEAWTPVDQQVDKVTGTKTAVSAIAKYARLIYGFIPQLENLSAQVTQELISSNANSHQIYLASQQSLLIQKIENELSQVLSQQEKVGQAIKDFKSNADQFGTVLQGMLTGNKKQDISIVKDPRARVLLRNIAMIFVAVSQHESAIMQRASSFLVVKSLVGNIQKELPNVFATASNLQTGILSQNNRLSDIEYAGYVLGALSLIILFYLGWTIYSNNRRALAVTEEQNRRNQQAILRLLDEMTNLADGDLSVHATVTEDITGALADSVNYAIDALRGLVTTINQTSVQVATASERAQETAKSLTEAGDKQAKEITSTSNFVHEMSQSIDKMAEEADDVAQTAKQSVSTAANGGETVNRSIQGMDTIREQIQDTAKRIKRLGESSQEIGDIVSLINDIADQTNILALNAAIQASAAGEAGRGFAVVADEVQRLAERSANATKQIEALVKTIQTDTQEAIISMEQSTANVVAGGKLAEEAGVSLAEIQKSSNELAEKILFIADAAREQAGVAMNIMESMTLIQNITQQTSDGTQDTAKSIGQLTKLAAELRKSVAGFKLPDSEEESTFVFNEDADGAAA